LIGREEYLADAKASVQAQTYPPVVHLVEKTLGIHESTVRNRLIEMAEAEYGCEWVAFLDDDDVIYPNHLEKLASVVGPSTDMVYSRFKWVKDGVEQPFPHQWDMPGWDPLVLQRRNYIPVTVLLKIATFKRAGGFRPVMNEDWRLWQAMIPRIPSVVAIKDVTWEYRWRSKRNKAD